MVNRWTKREGCGDWLCPECRRADLPLQHKLVQLLAAYECRHGAIPKVVFEVDIRTNCRVLLDPSTAVALFRPDKRAEAARRAFEDLTPLPSERVVLVRDGGAWKIEEKTGVVPNVAFTAWIH